MSKNKQPHPKPPFRNPPPPDLGAEIARATFPSLQLPHPLEHVFKDALAQVTRGKGDLRHGQGRAFMEQTWLETANAHGPAFLTGQAEKKLRESNTLAVAERRTERLGALVYVAMAIIKDDIDNGAGGIYS
jgi:hypothetical protein